MAPVNAQRTFYRLVVLAVFGIVVTYFLLKGLPFRDRWGTGGYIPSSYDWEHRTPTYPVDPSEIVQLPSGTPRTLRRIQHDFEQDSKDEHHAKTQAERRAAIRDTTKKCWGAYQDFAWGHDELKPLTMTAGDPFSGWGATLVDSLDTLWIMGLKDEFDSAVRAVGLIDWDATTSSSISLFETNIRYLGGLLAAYDLSGERTLLSKAIELAHMLHAAFDTPNHMPVGTFNIRDAKDGKQKSPTRISLATIGTLSLEFTRLSQITGDQKYYSAIDRIKRELHRTQDTSKIPGMWPTYINAREDFRVDHNSFTLGASADSGYEYLPKMYAMLGGLDDVYGELHTKSMEAARHHLLFRPMIPTDATGSTPDILFSGTTNVNREAIELQPRVQHLGCFGGGHFALGGRLFDLDEHVKVGEQLARGCAWAYGATPTGIMPEASDLISCQLDGLAPCEWDEAKWKKEAARDLPKPYLSVHDARYMLRPEALESMFILYRITGKKDLQDIAWEMFQAVRNASETNFAHATISDVMETGTPEKVDSMESFWIAETLKYLYLLFSEPDQISLDDYVFNTEAHPFRIPKPDTADSGVGVKEPVATVPRRP